MVPPVQYSDGAAAAAAAAPGTNKTNSRTHTHTHLEHLPGEGPGRAARLAAGVPADVGEAARRRDGVVAEDVLWQRLLQQAAQHGVGKRRRRLVTLFALLLLPVSHCLHDGVPAADQPLQIAGGDGADKERRAAEAGGGGLHRRHRAVEIFVVVRVWGRGRGERKRGDRRRRVHERTRAPTPHPTRRPKHLCRRKRQSSRQTRCRCSVSGLNRMPGPAPTALSGAVLSATSAQP